MSRTYWPKYCRHSRSCSEDIVKWDLAETSKGGPFQEILDGSSAFIVFFDSVVVDSHIWIVDIFVNCIYLNEKIPHFLTPSFVNEAGENRRLSVIVDVSCDTTNPNNPIPVYSSLSSFTNPIVNGLTGYVALSEN